MDSQQEIALSVCRWSAWAPGITDRSSWQAWADGNLVISGSEGPDVKFVAPMMRRRLSSLSRMAFRVAADCLSEAEDGVAFVFCSRYGEYDRSYGILRKLAEKEFPSAAAFSMSVHNTAASLLAIERGDTAQATAIANGAATMEAGFLEAWSLLHDGAASAVLLVYHDEPLPALYAGQETTVDNRAALAMLLRHPDSAQTEKKLQLSWGERNALVSERKAPSDPALKVLRLFLTEGDPVVIDAGRMVWTWSADAAVA